MALTRPTTVPNRTTKTSGHIKVLAPPYEACAKCGNMNSADVGTLWRVADERGCTLQCDACGHCQPYPTVGPDAPLD